MKIEPIPSINNTSKDQEATNDISQFPSPDLFFLQVPPNSPINLKQNCPPPPVPPNSPNNPKPNFPQVPPNSPCKTEPNFQQEPPNKQLKTKFPTSSSK